MTRIPDELPPPQLIVRRDRTRTARTAATVLRTLPISGKSAVPSSDWRVPVRDVMEINESESAGKFTADVSV